MDVSTLLAPIEGPAPSGVELRHDDRFLAIDRLLDPADKSVRLNPDGSINGGAPQVSWQLVSDQGMALASEGRDLKLLVILVRAGFALDGFGGLAQGLDMLTQTLAQYWDSLHPALRERPDAKAASLPRANALKDLENDDNGLLGDLRFGFPLVVRGIGPISGDDLASAVLSDFAMLNRAASGLSQAEKDALVSAHGQRVSRVSAASRAFAAEQPEEAAAMIAGLEACTAGVQALERAFEAATGLPEGQALVLPELRGFLDNAAATLCAGRDAVAGLAAPE
ncbi:type VI secretion system ImpA family N-terminal domain-containing protein, partial [Citreicella sp. C3M06]|uniref:type VI secretion system protein TssA n=1 Tax=Citreicella sp. C3M06 TaxID=2841564 RepID=UPI001C09A751